MKCKKSSRCQVVGSGFVVRAMRRYQLIRKNFKAVRHALSHIGKGGSVFQTAIYSCQRELIEKFRRETPYSASTGARDILWRISRDFERICREEKRKP